MAKLAVDTGPLNALTITNPPPSGAVSLPVRGYLYNMGKQPVNNVLLVAPELGYQSSVADVPVRYTGNAIVRVLPSLTLTRCGTYTLTLVADPSAQVDDPRRWNNTSTYVVNAEPDLAILTTTWGVYNPGPQEGVLYITSTVANLKVLATPPVSGVLWLSSTQGTLIPAVPFAIPPIPFGHMVIVTGHIPLPCCGAVYSITMEVDSAALLPEKDRNNNRLVLEVDTRADLVASASLSVLLPHYGEVGVLTVSITTTNAGIWQSPPLSAVVTLSDAFGNPIVSVRHFDLPPLERGASASYVFTSTLPPSAPDLYLLRVFVDSGEELEEKNESNNVVELTVPVVITTMLQPDSATYLSSTSGILVFLFPSGTVTLPTEIRFTPLWPRELPPGPPLGIVGFNLSAYQGGQPISLTLPHPVAVTWAYRDTELAGLKEEELGLYQLVGNNRWQRVLCPAEERRPEENRLYSCLHQLGTYIFGGSYKQYLPCILLEVGH